MERVAQALLLCAALCSVAACERAARFPVLAKQTVTALYDDRGERCLDMGPSRVCWVDGRAFVVAETRSPTPPTVDAPRCAGAGAARVCVDPDYHAGNFTCDAARCVQAHPRLPDAAEWECVELAAVVWCHSATAAAGIDAGPTELGFVCGARRGVAESERICVDYSPDRPADHPGYHCRFSYLQGGLQRVCSPGTGPRVADRCRTTATCPSGTRCEHGRCLPAEPAPSCWFDVDCGQGARCRFGTCNADSA